MEISGHIKTKWTIRGDYNRRATDAWVNGMSVKLPNYRYGEARYDSETGVVMLSSGGSVTTAIKRYEHMEVIPLENVSCDSCGRKYSEVLECPDCGDVPWTRC